MATGMYLRIDGLVQVDYDGTSIPVSRSKYEENGYMPEFEKLPSEAEYMEAREEAMRRDAKGG